MSKAILKDGMTWWVESQTSKLGPAKDLNQA